ncbi:Adenylate cyclase [Pseudodesulfovibrio hydrargyri]|uniref:Adenylate cyclase n=1 Tax=Pseudodesulfovibrio hydrargyri TaxID=2125990 RepID=A0A1J5N0F1_9BACT|nr:class I adenylate cyclase [Pseudodesulfovibrio hydrargyri]OIQ52142.1 Adenylate cyclase [Pseudodesulfovibrio hydrargyri]
MGQDIPNIRTLARDIGALSEGAPSGGPGIGELTADVMRWCDATPHPAHGEAVPLAEALLALYRLAANSADIHTVQACLQALVRSNRFGRTLCVRCLNARNTPLPRLEPKVAAWPARDRLALAHAMLKDFPGDMDRDTLTWIEERLKPLMGTDPEELVPFVARLGEQDEVLAFPVRQVIVGGLFGRHLNSRLTNGVAEAYLEELCRVIRGLGDSAHGEALAQGVALGRFKANETLLRTIAAVGEAGNKTILDTLLKILPKADAKVGGACLEALIRQDHPGMGKLLASVRSRMPGIRAAAIARAPLLGDIGYVQYISSQPEERRADVQLEMLGALEAIAPDFVRNVSGECPARGTGSPRVLEAAPPAQPRRDAPEAQRTGFLKGLFRSRPRTLQDILPKPGNVRDQDLPGSAVDGGQLENRELTGLGLAGSSFVNTGFFRGKLSNVDLADGLMRDCTLSGIEFREVRLTGMEFAGTRFEECVFTDCTFTGAFFSGCAFKGCRFRTSTFSETALRDCRMDRSDFTACTLAGSILHGCSVRSSRFEECDLSFSEWIGDDFRGVEFCRACLHGLYIRDCVLLSMELPGSSVTRSVIKNSDAGHPQFMANRLRQLTVFAREAEKNGVSKSRETDPFRAQRALAAWSRELTFMRRERRMLDNNRQRMHRAMGTLTRDQQAFLRMLPLLLDSDLFERRHNFGNIPSSRVWGYYPCLTELELVGERMGLEPEFEPSPEVRIQAVYAMGSLGTVAQTSSSDLDCWVCYDGDVTMTVENGLRRKLDAMALWADSDFGLEVHFYPMRMDDVRDNRFLSGDEESSGSAQVLLLKEEFYRTALKLAGKNIAWWVTPAGASRKMYESCIRAARRYPLCGKPRLEDFGHLAEVPPAEYFGGSLWQMVKAIHSPFKSVLKLGLLETYAAPGASALPLCDRIKRNLIRNRQGRQDTDPYTALYSTLHDYYSGRGEDNAAALLKESFRLKANLSDIPLFMNLPTRPEDESLISVLFGSGYVEPGRLAESHRTWPFDKSLRMGAHVRRYMVDTYQRIQEGLSAGRRDKGRTRALINPEDLTRMGRRIAANFARKNHKIMRVPFMDTRENGFPLLHFSAEKATGKPTVWTVRGGTRVQAKQAAEHLQLLHRNQFPVHLLAWLLANRIFHPKSLLQADRSIAPIALADLQKLMAALHDAFPFAETFEPDINEGLRAEEISRAFFIVNMAVPREASRIERVSVIYSTNWGEMFCRTFLQPGPLFERDPARFLAEKVGQTLSETVKLGLFTPKGSQCRRITLI